MIIIFYDANKEQVYICTEHDKTKVIHIDDPHLMDYIPNDDVLYVEDAHFITKMQFKEWLEGDLELVKDVPDSGVSRFTGLLDERQPWNAQHQVQKMAQGAAPPSSPGVQRHYLHPTANGTIRIEDIKTQKFPDGIQLNGKWHFIPVDMIGEDLLMDSSHFQVLLGKGKIEIVPESYVQANKHKQKSKVSPAQAALDAILVPADVKAEAAASGDWNSPGDEVAPEILIEG
jgi:hypothetical protein